MPPLLVTNRRFFARSQLSFQAVPADVDERPLPGERAEQCAQRLAEAKARKVFEQHSNAIVIGCDQCAELDGTFLHKPGTEENAAVQLARCSGQTVIFHTAIALLSPDGDLLCDSTPTEVRFRTLSEEEIHTYIKKEEVLDCAGSFKCEALGITLFEAIRSEDPTALEGLPLIKLHALLRQIGVNPLKADSQTL